MWLNDKDKFSLKNTSCPVQLAMQTIIIKPQQKQTSYFWYLFTGCFIMVGTKIVLWYIKLCSLVSFHNYISEIFITEPRNSVHTFYKHIKDNIFKLKVQIYKNRLTIVSSIVLDIILDLQLLKIKAMLF